MRLIQTENSSYFVASRHKLSAFFSLIFRFSSCHHPLLASALAKIMQDEGNRVVVGKDENAVRQLISMISSENQHVVWFSLSINVLVLFLICLKLPFIFFFVRLNKLALHSQPLPQMSLWQCN